MGRSGLTMTEREHWKKRIQARIATHIERILADHPTLMPTMLDKAVKQAHKDIGIDKIIEKKKKIEAKQKELALELGDLQEQIACKVLDLSARTYRQNQYGHNQEIQRSLRKRILVIRQKLLSKDETGKKIIGLQKEMEEVLDTVWLATSPQQVKDLWVRVLAYLGENPTKLQKEAIDLPSIEGFDGGKTSLDNANLDVGLDELGLD